MQNVLGGVQYMTVVSNINLHWNFIVLLEPVGGSLKKAC